MRKLILLAAAAALGACGNGSEESPQGTARAGSTPPAAKADDGEGGRWRRADTDAIGGSALLFGRRGERPLAALRCDAALETLLIERMTEKPVAGADVMKVSAGGEAEQLPVMWDGASLPVAGASVRLEDPLTDRLSGLSGTIELELKGEPRLSLPPDRRIGTLIEECRQA